MSSPHVTVPLEPDGDGGAALVSMSTPDLRPRVASGIRWGILDQTIRQVVRLGVTVILTKLIAPRDFGLIGIAIVVVNFAALLSGVGFGPALVQRPQLRKEHVGAALLGSFVLGTVMAVALVLTSGPIANFFDEPRVQPVLVFMSVVFLCQGLEAVPNAILRRHLMFREFTLSTTIAGVVSGVVGVVLAFAWRDVWALAWSAVAESFLAAVLAWVFAFHAGVWRPTIAADGRAFKDIFGYSAFVTGGQMLAYGQNNGDNFLVGKVLGATALGYYNLAYRVMLFPIQKVADLMYTVSLPAFANVQSDVRRMAAGFQRATRYVAFICFPVTVGIALTAPLVVPLVFGERWVPAVVTLQILAANGPRIVVNRLNGTLYHATGKPHWGFWVNAVSLVLYIPAFALGTEWGIEGVAIGFTVAGFALLPLGLALSARVLDLSMKDMAVNLVPVTVATTIMAAVVLLTGVALPASIGDAGELVILVLVGVAAYALAVWRLDRPVVAGAWNDLVRRVR